MIHGVPSYHDYIRDKAGPIGVCLACGFQGAMVNGATGYECASCHSMRLEFCLRDGRVYCQFQPMESDRCCGNAPITAARRPICSVEPTEEERAMSKKHLQTRPEWEDALRSGRKTIDARWLTNDVAGLKVGDIVRYPGAKAEIKQIRFYRGFRDLLAAEDWRKIAPDAKRSADVLTMLENGHPAAARPTGVVAIELEPVKE